MVKIDAHQHYWHPGRGDYGWMPKGDAVLDRPWRPEDLAPSLVTAGVERTVLVQAAPSVHETEYMLGIADATPTVAGVVGWIDFENRGDLGQLERLKRHPRFVGVRPMIQDIADVDWMLRDDIRWAFDALVDLDLAFDALGFPVHLANFLKVLSRHPDLRAVIDHAMKPRIRDQMDGRDAFSDWAAGMRRLAAETGAFCKLSGLVTEAHANWTVDDLRPFAEHVLECFGPERTMWGSDWPVSLLGASYEAWHEAAQALAADLDDAAQAQLFGKTAEQFYRLSV